MKLAPNCLLSWVLRYDIEVYLSGGTEEILNLAPLFWYFLERSRWQDISFPPMVLEKQTSENHLTGIPKCVWRMHLTVCRHKMPVHTVSLTFGKKSRDIISRGNSTPWVNSIHTKIKCTILSPNKSLVVAMVWMTSIIGKGKRAIDITT